MKLLVCQIRIPPMDSREEQLRHIDALIARLGDELTARTVDLVVLPELTTIEYSKRNFERINTFSEPLHGETCRRFAALCRRHGVAVCFGMPRREGSDTYISQVVLDRNGDYLTHYDKIHTAEYGDSSEARHFRRGNHVAVFELDGIRAGLVICYDLRFPELTRRLCDGYGVDLILHPVAFARDLSFPTWKDFVVTRALENQVYWVSVNQAGEHFGQSIICPPWVDDATRPELLGREETFQEVEISRDALARVREAIPYRRDRLPDYAMLALRGAAADTGSGV